MKADEERAGNTAAQKEKIRERYKGIDTDMLDVIPAIPPEDFYHAETMKRVGVYARVSTDDPRQTSSYELQKNHYQDVVSHHENWSLVKIYADEGISGTSLQHRDAFLEMIEDCKNGLLDMIITKTVARFARNVIDCIGYARELAAMNPPIGIFFETENIYTLNPNSEMSLSFIATLAQEESHTKSEIMNASIEMRFRRGIFLTPPLLGYDLNEEGKLIINQDEAKTVILIFFMYLYGYSTATIAETLTKLGRKTKPGNSIWSANSVLNILQNERYCGDVLARKTFTPNYLNHKAKKNRKDRNQYRQKDHHEGIIARADFLAVQQLINNAKYGNKGFFPTLHVIKDGVLSGYVSIHPRWAGFQAEDYIAASTSAVSRASPDEVTIKASSGDFDLRGYEIARGQFFGSKITVSFTIHSITFSSESIRQFPSCTMVELLINPDKMAFSVRRADKENRNAVQWAKIHQEISIPRSVSSTAFLPTLFKLMGWNEHFRYRSCGRLMENKGDRILVFNLKDAEVFISAALHPHLDNDSDCIMPFTVGARKDIAAYPTEWATSFGENYYTQFTSPEIADFMDCKTWNVTSPGVPYITKKTLEVTKPKIIEHKIEQIINEFETGENK